jgi:hypothetical protein
MNAPMHEKTPDECFELLKPGLAELARAIRTAPCNRGGLAVMVATFTFGVASAELGKDAFSNAREVADLIVETMRPEAPKPKVVG